MLFGNNEKRRYITGVVEI